MPGTPFIDGPSYITDASDDLYVPSAATIYALVRQIHLVNTHSAAIAVTLYVGATGAEAAGTEILDDYSMASKEVLDLYFPAGLKLTSTTFLVGDAGTTNLVVCTIMGELYAV